MVSRCGLELLWIVDDNFLVGREWAVGIAVKGLFGGASVGPLGRCGTHRVSGSQIEANHRARPLRGGVVETPAEVRRIAHHFRCNAGLASYVSPVCNAPWTSAVIAAGAGLRPCFFRQTIGTLKSGEDRKAILNSPVRGRIPIDARCAPPTRSAGTRVCLLNWDPDGVASLNRPGSKTIYRNVTSSTTRSLSLASTLDSGAIDMVYRAMVGIIFASALIQLVPIGHQHDNPAVVSEPAWDSSSTRQLVKRACFNCHSNETTWPWYSAFAPISWLIEPRCQRRQEVISISSDWNRSCGQAEKIEERVRNRRNATVWFYLPMHPEAKLTPDEKNALIDGPQNSMKDSENKSP